MLQKQLAIDNVRELEDLVIEAIYQHVIQGRIDQRNAQIEIHNAIGRDVQPQEYDGLMATLLTWYGTEQCRLTRADWERAWMVALFVAGGGGRWAARGVTLGGRWAGWGGGCVHRYKSCDETLKAMEENVGYAHSEHTMQVTHKTEFTKQVELTKADLKLQLERIEAASRGGSLGGMMGMGAMMGMMGMGGMMGDEYVQPAAPRIGGGCSVMGDVRPCSSVRLGSLRIAARIVAPLVAGKA